MLSLLAGALEPPTGSLLPESDGRSLFEFSAGADRADVGLSVEPFIGAADGGFVPANWGPLDGEDIGMPVDNTVGRTIDAAVGSMCSSTGASVGSNVGLVVEVVGNLVGLKSFPSLVAGQYGAVAGTTTFETYGTIFPMAKQDLPSVFSFCCNGLSVGPKLPSLSRLTVRAGEGVGKWCGSRCLSLFSSFIISLSHDSIPSDSSSSSEKP